LNHPLFFTTCCFSPLSKNVPNNQSSFSFSTKLNSSSSCLESILTHNYYNTIHGASPDKKNRKQTLLSYSSIQSFIFLVRFSPLTSIFSTRVISGAKSTPDLNVLLERKQAGRMRISFSLFNYVYFRSFSYLFGINCSCSVGNFKYEFKLYNSRQFSRKHDGFNIEIICIIHSTCNSSSRWFDFVLLFNEKRNRFVCLVETNRLTSRNTFTKYSINTINELPERSIDEDR